MILFIVNSVYPQSEYKIELNGGRVSTTGWGNTLLPYWDSGLSLGITASKQINKEIELTSTFSYQNFKFQPNRIGLVAHLDFLGPAWNIKGENSNVYNILFGLRILTSAKRIKTFLSFNSGFQYINQGKIFIKYTPIPPVLPSPSSTSLFDNSNRNYFMGIVSLGFGLSFNIISKINLITEGKLVTTFKDFTTYSILTAGVQFSF